MTVTSPSTNNRVKCGCGNIAVCKCGNCALHCHHPEQPGIVFVPIMASLMHSSLNIKEQPPHRGRAVDRSHTYDRATSSGAEYTSYVFDHLDS